jgi:hypothetical protein
MTTDEYIRNEITRHLGINNISYRETQITEMVQSVFVGTGAFQIIFDQVFDPYSEDGDETYVLEKWRPLDRSMIRETTTVFGTMYAYDGNRYQWSKRETIMIDLSIIRQKRLEDLGI